MSIDSTWLRCPNCFLELSPVDDRVFGCESGHRFDRSKYGFLTLLPPKAPRTIGDDRAMLAARARLLEFGAYDPIAAEMRASIAAHLKAAHDDSLRIADFGCGTGHYAAHVAGAHTNSALLLADRSPDAVRASLRLLPAATGVVLDIWRPLPVRDGVVDIALNVFAPRNPSEFARVLAPDGILTVVVPTTDHLRELRAAGALLDIPPGKAEQVTEQFAAVGLERLGRSPVEYVLDADDELQSLLADMGPSAHHRALTGAPSSTIAVTVSVDVLVFARAEPAVG